MPIFSDDLIHPSELVIKKARKGLSIKVAI
jgi:hypothetical protein